MSKRIVFATFGSLGDLHPYIGIARELLHRGHRPVIATLDLYREAIEAEGIAYAPMRPAASDFGDFPTVVSRIFHPIKGPEYLIGKLVLPYLRPAYDDLMHAAREADLLVSHPLSIAMPLVAEKLGLPWASTVLAPLSLFSCEDPPVFTPVPWLRRVRRIGSSPYRALFGLIKLAGVRWERPIARLRRELGLRPARALAFFEGQFSPQLNLALFSRELATPAKDWPTNTRVCGFPFHDGAAADAQTTDRLERFLQAGEPPLVFALGSSAVMIAGDFWDKAIAASRMLGRRALLLTGRDLPVPELGGSGDIAAFAYLPYSQVFPRAAAIVHQAGIGTLSQALAAGRPQLIVPVSFDQPDNALRSQRIGVAQVLPFRNASVTRLTREIGAVLGDASIAARAAAVGERVRAERGSAAAAEALLAL